MERLLASLTKRNLLHEEDVLRLRSELSGLGSNNDRARHILSFVQGRGSSAEALAEAVLAAQLEDETALPVLRSTVRIMLIEDNPGDVELTRRALLRQPRFELMGIARNGEEALEQLARDDLDPRDTPDLVLLDLDLPGIDGLEVLRQLKEHPVARQIPVVVLSGTTRKQAPLRAFQTHAVSFIPKPANLATYRRLAQRLETYWSQVTALP